MRVKRGSFAPREKTGHEKQGSISKRGKNTSSNASFFRGEFSNSWSFGGDIEIQSLDIWTHTKTYEPGSKLLVLGMVIQPLIGNPTPTIGNIGSLDPSTYTRAIIIKRSPA